MKKILALFSVLAMFSFAVPTVASAQDKPKPNTVKKPAVTTKTPVKLNKKLGVKAKKANVAPARMNK